jgi:hypothetical protein
VNLAAGLPDTSAFYVKGGRTACKINIREEGFYFLKMRVFSEDYVNRGSCFLQIDTEESKKWEFETKFKNWKWVRKSIGYLSKGIHAFTIQQERIFGIDQLEVEKINLDPTLPDKLVISEVQLKADELFLKGWALSTRNITEIALYLDNELLGQAKYGTYRPDVLKNYPQYYNSKSGFIYSSKLEHYDKSDFIIEINAYSGDKLLKSVKRRVSRQ